MLGMYLIMTLLSKFAPSGEQLVPSALFAQHSVATQLHVRFDRLNGIRVGAPVFADGEIVGNVSNIVVANAEQGAVEDAEYSVEVKLNEEIPGDEQSGVVALISCPLSADRENAEAAVELIAVPRRDLSDRAISPTASKDALTGEIRSIVGYSSYEQFWADSRHALSS